MRKFHMSADGNARECFAHVQTCPLVHGDSLQEVRSLYEASMSSQTFATAKATPLQKGFSAKTFYGATPPRTVQIEPLNAVSEALEEGDATQLVAACGTGKSYMGRQLLRREMEKEGANGVAVVLTSSIKLAHDTAEDLRPTGGYDKTFGEFGKDYEVIEVHSDARPAEGRPSVRKEGVVNVERIQEQISSALSEGKKVVIISTYDSCSKVQAAQALLGERAEADVIFHDEAHNILGQQTPTTIASDENELTAYTGFHNRIPGAIQARKRIYATATPVVRELPGDKDSPENLDEAIEVARRMQEGDQKARVTYYSDDIMVGGVSGFISQEAAVEAGCLAKPEYSIRTSNLTGRLRDFDEAVVTPEGKLVERSKAAGEAQLTPRTYGAVVATLEAMAADGDASTNPSDNVLAYVGAIPQAEAFRNSFRQVALHQAGGLSLEAASKAVNSPDENLRRAARMRLLAEYGEAKAAHSRTDSASTQERREAFTMFQGKAVREGAWHPHKRVLANVDIFSEGVSIPEIDTVIVADDEKCSERAMTQAIGRSLRKVPGNDYKTTGHVIVPSVMDESGVHVTEASVHLAAYGATRVERAVTASKLRGEGVIPDSSTKFRVHGEAGVSEKSARSFAQESVGDVVSLVTASEVESAHQYLQRVEGARYGSLSEGEKAELVKSRMREKAASTRSPSERERLQLTLSHLDSMSAHEMRELRRNGRVVTSALAIGDVSSLSPALSRALIQTGVLKTAQRVAEVPMSKKREFLQKHSRELSYAVLTPSKQGNALHDELRTYYADDFATERTVMRDSMNLLNGGSETPTTQKLSQAWARAMESDEFVATAYSWVAGDNLAPIFESRIIPPSFREGLISLEEERRQAVVAEASAGAQEYTVDPDSVQKNGKLRTIAVRRLLHSES